MKKITTEQLNEILENHKKWLNNDGGKKADLSETDLSVADLSGADLSETDLSETDLSGANLREANLRGADLRGAYLSGANLIDAGLRGADLRGAILRGVNLIDADLREANLRGADLREANLRGVNLKDADLREANLREANLNNVNYNETTNFLALQCPEEGSFIGYKKANYKIVKLLITEDSLRSSATTRKCRCSKAKVLSITNIENTKEFEMVQSNYDKNFIYKVGKIVEVKDFDKDRWNECSTGIHFFITRQEAVNF